MEPHEPPPHAPRHSGSPGRRTTAVAAGRGLGPGRHTSLAEAYMQRLAADAAARDPDAEITNPVPPVRPGAAAEAVRRLLLGGAGAGAGAGAESVSPLLLGTTDRAPGSAGGARGAGDSAGSEGTNDRMQWAPYQLPVGVAALSPAGRSGDRAYLQSNSQNPQHETGGFAVPPSLPMSPLRTANPTSTPLIQAEAAATGAQATPLWRQGDAWLQHSPEAPAKPGDLSRVAEYMQDILSDRNKLALEQKARISELELMCVQYAQEIGSLRGLVSKLEDGLQESNKVLSAEVASILKEVGAAGSAEDQQRNGHGKPSVRKPRCSLMSSCAYAAVLHMCAHVYAYVDVRMAYASDTKMYVHTYNQSIWIFTAGWVPRRSSCCCWAGRTQHFSHRLHPRVRIFCLIRNLGGCGPSQLMQQEGI